MSDAQPSGRAQQTSPALTLRKESSTPFPMYSITIIMVLPAQTDQDPASALQLLGQF